MRSPTNLRTPSTTSRLVRAIASTVISALAALLVGLMVSDSAGASTREPSDRDHSKPTTMPSPPANRSVSAGVPVTEASELLVSGLSFSTISRGVEIATAYGDLFAGAHGAYIRFQPGAFVPRHYYTAATRGILVSGRLANVVEGAPATNIPLQAGDSFAIPAGAQHTDRCLSRKPCLLLTFQDFGFEPIFS